MKILIPVLILLSLNSFAGNKEGGNAGDFCESKFRNTSRTIEHWLEKEDGTYLLKLPSHISPEEYESKMLFWINNAKVICTDKQIYYAGGQKTCKNSTKFEDVKQYLSGNVRDQSGGWIVCNRELIEKRRDAADMFILVAHEYAGLSGFETNENGIKSNYYISQQYYSFLENKTLKYLSGNVIPVNVTDTSVFTIVEDISLGEVRKMLADLVKNASNPALSLTEKEKSVDLVIRIHGYRYHDVHVILRFTQMNSYKVKVSVEKGTVLASGKPIEEAAPLCRIDRDYCPTIETRINTWSGELNSIYLKWEAAPTSDPDDDSYGATLFYQEGLKGKPLWTLAGWDDEEDSGVDYLFYFTSNP